MILKKIKITTIIEKSFFSLIKKCKVSYDTLAGIPWMSHSRITKISERVAYEGPYDKITWQKLSERIKKICGSLHIVEIGRILKSYSKVQYRDIKLLYKLVEEIKKKEKIEQIDLHACASICYALNSLHFKDNDLFHLLFLKIKELGINKNSSFPIVIIQNAYSKHCNENFFRHMSLQLLIYFFKKFDTYKNSCTPQGLTMLLNSFAQILKPSPDFLKNENELLFPICIDEPNILSNFTLLETVGQNFDSKEQIVCLTHDDNGDSSDFTIKERKTATNTVEESDSFENVLKNNVLCDNRFIEMERSKVELKEENREKLNKPKEETLINEKNKLKMKTAKENEINEVMQNENLLKKYFFKLLLEISKTLEKMNPHSLALIINSCTRIPFEISTEFLNMLTEETNKKIHLASIRHLSLIINGYIKLKLKNPIFVSNIFHEIEKKIFSCDAQQLCFILSSMYKLNKKDEFLLKNINSKFILTVRKMNISTLCNVFYFYTKLGVYDTDLFKLFEIYLKRLINEATIHHLSLAAYVLSKNKKKENELISLIVQKAEQLLKGQNSCSNQEQAKSILILINSLSELNIFSQIMGEYLYFIIHVNEAKIATEESEKKKKKLEANICNFETYIQKRILSKQIYISLKTCSLYDTYIRSTIQKMN